MKTQEVIKYAGAGQVAKEFTLSPLGVRVANVLGQVGRGIYHYDSSLLGKNKPQWSNEHKIIAVLRRRLATFDDSDLTVLALCCKEAGLTVKLSGRNTCCLTLEFTDGSLKIPETAPFFCNELMSVDEFASVTGLGVRSNNRHPKFGDLLFKRERDRYYSDGQLKQLNLSVSNAWMMDSIELGALVVAAHQACIRVAIGGLSHKSLDIWLSKRENRDGNFWEQHPDWSTACEMLKADYWVDFESVN